MSPSSNNLMSLLSAAKKTFFLEIVSLNIQVFKPGSGKAIKFSKMYIDYKLKENIEL